MKERDLISKVTDVMDEFPETRDMDLKLYVKIVNIFYGANITVAQLKAMMNVNFESMSRIRRSIQNDREMFEASDEVKETRQRRKKQFHDHYSKAPVRGENISYLKEQAKAGDVPGVEL